MPRVGTLLLALAILVGAAWPAHAAKRPPRDVRLVVATLDQLVRGTEARGDDLAKAIDAWSQTLETCEADFDRLMRTEAGSIVAISVLGIDSSHAMAGVLGAEISRSSRRFAKLRVRDRAIRALARMLGRYGAATLTMADIDGCAVLAEWEATGLDVEKPPAAFAAAVAPLEAVASQVVFDRGMKRLRRLGMTRRSMGDLFMFPFIVHEPSRDDSSVTREMG